MKFLPLRDFDEVTSALNFSTPDCRVIGGCDLYTTKAAGSDKKLYRNIENSLESQYESLLRISAPISPPYVGPSPLDLSRSSPFGPLSQVSSRRTFAYLIATLNASHPDYDFSHILRPADFRKERSLRAVINAVDSTLYNLRPSSSMNVQVPSQITYVTISYAPPASQAWGPHMWSLIDKEMELRECNVYCWAPPDEPFDGDEGSIWSLNYFFFNKDLKRVAYLHVRAVPAVTHSPRQRRGLGLGPQVTSGYHDGRADKDLRHGPSEKAVDVVPLEADEMLWNDAELHHDGAVEFDGTGFYNEYDEDINDAKSDEDDYDYQNDYEGLFRGMSEDMVASMEM